VKEDTDAQYRVVPTMALPWTVTKVELDSAARRVDVLIEDLSGAKRSCPECGKKASVYDHSDERVWRHLNTCQFGTYIHYRLPRIKQAFFITSLPIVKKKKLISCWLHENVSTKRETWLLFDGSHR
jgi:transposase